MRQAFVKALVELAIKDPRIMLLTGDLGYSILEPFAERFRERFFNVGVAEQNMVGLATGLAEAGFIPYIYSIGPFAALRPYEFIRNGPVLHQFPVRIVGVGDGLEYCHDGATHHGLEDVGVMRIQPGLTVIVPADFEQTRTAFLKTWDMPGPIYYRIGKDDRTVIPGLEGEFSLEQAQIVRTGRDFAIITMGGITKEAMRSIDWLADRGTWGSVVVVASLNPPPVRDLVGILRRFKVVFSVEAHYVVGGLGSLVAEIIADHGLNCRLVRLGVKTLPDGVSGSQAFLYHRYGISSEAINEFILEALGKGERKGFPKVRHTIEGFMNVGRE